MPKTKFDNLLGFKDFGEALFAQAQAVDDVRTTSYSRAQQAKIADLEEAVGNLQRETTPSGLQVEVPDAVAFTANSAGVLDDDQLPVVIEFALTQFGLDVLADPRTSVVFVPNGVIGSEVSNGVYEITGVTKLSASIEVTITYAGVLQGRWIVPVTTTKAAPPPVATPVPPPTVPPPIPPATPAASVWLAPPTSQSFVLAGSIEVEGNYQYQAVLNASFYSLSGVEEPSNLIAYVASKPVGGIGWTQQSPEVVGSPNEYLTYVPEFYGSLSLENPGVAYPSEVTQLYGFISLSQNIVLPAGKHLIGFFLRLEYGPTVNLSDPAIVQPV